MVTDTGTDVSKGVLSYRRLKFRKTRTNCSSDGCLEFCVKVKTTFCENCYSLAYDGKALHVNGKCIRRCSKCSYEGPEEQFSGVRGTDTKCCGKCLRKQNGDTLPVSYNNQLKASADASAFSFIPFGAQGYQPNYASHADLQRQWRPSQAHSSGPTTGAVLPLPYSVMKNAPNQTIPRNVYTDHIKTEALSHSGNIPQNFFASQNEQRLPPMRYDTLTAISEHLASSPPDVPYPPNKRPHIENIYGMQDSYLVDNSAPCGLPVCHEMSFVNSIDWDQVLQDNTRLWASVSTAVQNGLPGNKCNQPTMLCSPPVTTGALDDPKGHMKRNEILPEVGHLNGYLESSPPDQHGLRQLAMDIMHGKPSYELGTPPPQPSEFDILHSPSLYNSSLPSLSQSFGLTRSPTITTGHNFRHSLGTSLEQPSIPYLASSPQFSDSLFQNSAFFNSNLGSAKAEDADLTSVPSMPSAVLTLLAQPSTFASKEDSANLETDFCKPPHSLPIAPLIPDTMLDPFMPSHFSSMQMSNFSCGNGHFDNLFTSSFEQFCSDLGSGDSLTTPGISFEVQ